MNSSGRINVKNIDYFKFRKLVIDGNRDDFNHCSKEIKAMCDGVQTLKFRDDEFDDISDRKRFADICIYYEQILQSKRIDPTDVRIKSGWWGDHKNAYSAGKLKPAILKDTLISKAKDWSSRSGDSSTNIDKLAEKIDGPGLFVFKHRDNNCFQYIGRADKVFAQCVEKLKKSFDGSCHEPISALLIISMATDWDFYFIPVDPLDTEPVLRIIENDLILKHDCIWPHGLNFQLHVDSLLEVSEFRKSCLRHNWPPKNEQIDRTLVLSKIRNQLKGEPVETSEEKSINVPHSPARSRSTTNVKHSIELNGNDSASLLNGREQSPDGSNSTYTVEWVNKIVSLSSGQSDCSDKTYTLCEDDPLNDFNLKAAKSTNNVSNIIKENSKRSSSPVKSSPSHKPMQVKTADQKPHPSMGTPTRTRRFNNARTEKITLSAPSRSSLLSDNNSSSPHKNAKLPKSPIKNVRPKSGDMRYTSHRDLTKKTPPSPSPSLKYRKPSPASPTESFRSLKLSKSTSTLKPLKNSKYDDNIIFMEKNFVSYENHSVDRESINLDSSTENIDPECLSISDVMQSSLTSNDSNLISMTDDYNERNLANSPRPMKKTSNRNKTPQASS